MYDEGGEWRETMNRSLIGGDLVVWTGVLSRLGDKSFPGTILLEMRVIVKMYIRKRRCEKRKGCEWSSHRAKNARTPNCIS